MPRRKRMVTLTPEEIQNRINELDEQITALNVEIKGLNQKRNSS